MKTPNTETSSEASESIIKHLKQEAYVQLDSNASAAFSVTVADTSSVVEDTPEAGKVVEDFVHMMGYT
ncbi:hypothetical protein V6N12_043502 [Hibiscus sabdariffa]|uniref:Uncharacterized protein n=1 Tax=Hibiscus sabdariffa TaxID=183260 RepID=A0ABR2DHH6_9ROSI